MTIRSEREYLLETIAALNARHAKSLEPYIARLVEIEALNPPPPVIVDILMLDPAILARTRTHLERRP